MGDKKVTKMIVRGDLQCYKCRKKIKTALCKIPQIQEQIYDEKNNQVKITVVCCSPEKVRDMICSKACGAVQSVEIVEEELPVKQCKDGNRPLTQKPCGSTPPPPPGGSTPPAPKSCDSTPPSKPASPKRKDPPPPPKQCGSPPKPCGLTPPKSGPPPVPTAIVPVPVLTPGYPQPVFYPVICCPYCGGYGGPCCRRRPPMCPDGCGRPVNECHGRHMCPDGCGRPIDECHRRPHTCPDGCGRPVDECRGRPPMCADGCGRPFSDCHGRPPMCADGCGRPVYECRGGSGGYYVGRCDYVSEENANGCAIM